MRCYLLLLVIVSLAVIGCGKAVEQHADVNPDGLTVLEADALLAQSAGSDAATPMPTNIVVNKDAGPLVEKTAQTIEAPRTDITDKPDDVSIQKALKKAGLYNGSIDGKIGPKTKEAIKEFQRSNGLVVDGKVGPKTWAALKGYLIEPDVSPADITN